MDISLKLLREQVVVITGASSGIGLATARAAARRGARVVLAARDEPALRRIVQEIRAEGGDAVYCVADVADAGEVHRVAEVALHEYGGFDTWVNNAGVSIYGRLDEVPLEDAKRLFDVNYWGIVNGSLAALQHLKRAGGALINLGSIVSDRAVPLQGHYSASKHAVKGFTDALRVELEHEGAPVSVTLIKPGAIDTPYPEHARNLMDHEPKHPAPVYRPETVAAAILHCAEHPRRSLTVGGGGRVNALLGMLVPGAGDRMMQGMFTQQQREDRPAGSGRRDTLYQPPMVNGRTRGDYPGHVMRDSVYTRAAMHPGGTALAVGVLAGLGLALAGAAGLFGGRGARRADDELFTYEEEEFRSDVEIAPGDEVGARAGELDVAEDDLALRGGDYSFRSGADQAY